MRIKLGRQRAEAVAKNIDPLFMLGLIYSHIDIKTYSFYGSTIYTKVLPVWWLVHPTLHALG